MTYKRANGTGSVYKLSGRRRKPWVACITSGWSLDDNGNAKQHKYVIGTYRTRNEGLIALAEYNKSPYLTDHANMTVADVYEYWKKTNTKFSYSYLRHIQMAFNAVANLHDRPYRSIIPIDIEEAIQPLTYHSQNRVIALFKLLDTEAIKLDIPIKNVHVGISTKKRPDKTERTIFTEDEIDALWEKSDDPKVRIILIYMYTGWRKQEFETILKKNVDITNWTMKGGMKTAAGKNRIVPVHPRIRPFVKELYDQAADDGLLYAINGKQASNNHTYRLFKSVMNELGLDHTIHETRHTFRTRLFNAGVDRLIIDKLLGHSNGSIGDITYTHLTIEQLSEEIEKLR